MQKKGRSTYGVFLLFVVLYVCCCIRTAAFRAPYAIYTAPIPVVKISTSFPIQDCRWNNQPGSHPQNFVQFHLQTKPVQNHKMLTPDLILISQSCEKHSVDVIQVQHGGLGDRSLRSHHINALGGLGHVGMIGPLYRITRMAKIAHVNGFTRLSALYEYAV